jgi:hypothetical protein
MADEYRCLTVKCSQQGCGEGLHDPCVTTDIETLITALYVKIECATMFCCWAEWRWKTFVALPP